MRAVAVIGASFGDEGKGLITDAFAAGFGGDCTVVRFNGGAQAGHTVCVYGARHVFHHIGAGSFAGAGTHLSRFFVAHPMMFREEYLALKHKMGRAPDITIDPHTNITTPFDMMMNQLLEMSRGARRHGSCGMGFGETIGRAEALQSLTAWDLYNSDVEVLMKSIRLWYERKMAPLFRRLRRKEFFGHVATVRLIERALEDPTMIRRFIADCEYMAARMKLREDGELARDRIVFEGAQGLGLCMDSGNMPHVTRSRTGLANVSALMKIAGIEKVAAAYVTRAYTTRHGAGPLVCEANPGEMDEWIKVVDGTNISNDWQGSLRVAPLDVSGVVARIAKDLGDYGKDILESGGIVMTCTDQIVSKGHKIPARYGGTLGVISIEDFHSAFNGFGIEMFGYSAGPVRDAVTLPAPMRA